MNLWWRKKDKNPLVTLKNKPIDLQILAEMIQDGVLTATIEKYFICIHKNFDLKDNPIPSFEFEQIHFKNENSVDRKYCMDFGLGSETIQQCTKEDYEFIKNLSVKPLDENQIRINKNVDVMMNYMRAKIQAYDEESLFVKSL